MQEISSAAGHAEQMLAASTAVAVKVAGPATAFAHTDVVLVVAHRAEVRLFIEQSLRNRGFSVIAVSCGVAAVEAVWSRPGAGAIVIEETLPDGSGIDIAMTLRSLCVHASVVIVSDNAHTGKENDAPAGIWRIGNPLASQDLADVVVRAMSNQCSRRVLIADDDSAARELLRLMLESAGYEVVEAENGAVLLSKLQREEYDVVITDILMPERDGLEALMAARKRTRTPRFIVLSGGDDVLLRVAQHLGADQVLSKPVRGEVLLQAVECALSRPLDLTEA